MASGYYCTSRTGGAAGSLDGITGYAAGDVARVHESDVEYLFVYDATKVAAADVEPNIVVPDNNSTGTGAWVLQRRAYYREFYIPASALRPCTTNGCAPLAQAEKGTNDIDVEYLAFDSGTSERCQIDFVMPEDWDLGTIKYKFPWSSATGSTAGDTCEWAGKAGAQSDNDAIDAALGTAQVISDTLLADNGADRQLTAATPAVTVGGTPALGDMTHHEFYRNVSGTDDMTEDAWLFGVWVQYKSTKSPAQW